MMPWFLVSPGHHRSWFWLGRINEALFTMGREFTLQWHHNSCAGISNHQPHDCLLNCLFRCNSKKKFKLCVTGLCPGNSPVTGEFPAQKASDVENVSIGWCHHELLQPSQCCERMKKGHTVKCHNNTPIYHVITYHTVKTVAVSKSDFRITTDSPYFALLGELWGVCCEDLKENWLCYIGIMLYIGMFVENISGLFLGLRPANERHRYKVTPSLIGWAQT